MDKFDKMTAEYQESVDSINKKETQIIEYENKLKEILSELDLLKQDITNTRVRNHKLYDEYMEECNEGNIHSYFYFEKNALSPRKLGHLKRLIQCFEEYSRRFRNNI